MDARGARVSDERDLLASTELFRRLNTDALQELAHRSRHRWYRRGEVLFREGDPSGLLFVLVSGALKLAVSSRDGDQLTLAVLHQPAAVVGEVGLVDGHPNEASCEALVPSEVLVLSREDLQPLLSSPEIAKGLLLTLVARVRQSVAQSSDLAFLSVLGRLAKALLNLAQPQRDGSGQAITLPLTQTELAQIVGGSRVTVNVQLRSLEHRGLLRVAGRQIVLLDLRRLEQLAAAP
jgi:CRP/FNR family cyclic AMP-dependent transcriptional regulator